ncbi:MAG: protein-PII uridylyltransferase, partial [SAR324 cluster bacterium]|nr:protein-PII uridylyltransferase [SAR324 cluster bacterium]
MDTNFSPIENYPFLSPFIFTENPQKLEKHKIALQKKLVKAWKNQHIEDSKTLEYLEVREKIFATVTAKYYEQQYKIIVEKSLITDSSFETLAQNTRLLDSIIHTAFEFAFTDLPILKERIVEDLKKESQFKKKTLPKNLKKLTLTQKKIENIESNPEDPEQRQLLKYYNSIEADLTQDNTALNKRLHDLKEQIPLAKQAEFTRDFLLNHLVIFARGGYGRAELSFASDRDLGYCLETQQLSSGEAEICRQFIIHIEHLLRISGIETAHQYFELNEDLSRFKEPSAIHTIPAILESRVLLGSNNLANDLKSRFFQILPYETFVLSQIRDYHDRTVPGLSEMNLKEDQGGLRSIQIPLWLAAATFGVFPNQTADMLALLIQKRIISPRQGFKLCQALEFLYDLRNFAATAEKFHIDDEARERGLTEKDIQINIINDATEQLYLLKKKRFQTIDVFDRYRLQMVNYIQDLSQAILQRLLDRTIVRTFSNFQVVVHLGQRQILEVNALEGMPQVPISLIFNDPTALLELFEYVGQSEYDLSFDLKDEMADLIRIITPDVIYAHRTQIAERFTKLMLTPFAANALRIMFDICEPINEKNQPRTLMGCFIPETNKMRFLLRNL